MPQADLQPRANTPNISGFQGESCIISLWRSECVMTGVGIQFSKEGHDLIGILAFKIQKLAIDIAILVIDICCKVSHQ